MNIKITAISDIGKERTNNEDAVIICPDLERQSWRLSYKENYLPMGRYGAIMVVADGLGGSNAGEIASSIAIQTIKQFFSKEKLGERVITESVAHQYLSESISLANKAIMEHVLSDPDSIGLGTTIVITWLIGDKAFIAWCGDSRCYCYNENGGLKQLTKDHSYVQELVDKGEITPKQSFNHQDGNIVTKCLGDVDAVTEPDIITYHIVDGDILLSCTDGLCGYCDDRSIEKEMLLHYDDLSTCLNKLLELALKSGGQDNISISLCATLPDKHWIPRISAFTKIKRTMYRMIKA